MNDKSEAVKLACQLRGMFAWCLDQQGTGRKGVGGGLAA
jgi:hypothetical protein